MFWKKLKLEFKEFFDGLLIAFAIGIVTDSTLLAFKVDIPVYFSWGFPLLYTVTIVCWIITFLLFAPLFGLLIKWMVKISPKWLQSTLESSSFWIWTLSIVSIVLIALIG